MLRCAVRDLQIKACSIMCCFEIIPFNTFFVRNSTANVLLVNIVIIEGDNLHFARFLLVRGTRY
jgi:hypothetical protein